ncbi:MAG: S8/S53 family peptidase [Oscillospiraceae bacterium]|nr:S8/S53 family peptidase [Oscillospiraceae bacterium]
MPFILPEDNKNNNKIDIKPSGILKVSPRPGLNEEQESVKKRVSGKKTLIPAAAVITVIIVSVIVYFNVFAGADKENQPDIDNVNIIPDMNTAPPESDVCGWWVFFDRVESRSGIENPGPNKNMPPALVFSELEFFEDKTVRIRHPGGETELYNWSMSGDIFSVLPDNISVYEIKNIDKIDYMLVKCESLDLKIYSETTGYFILKRDRERYIDPGDDVRNKDLRNYDFSVYGNLLNNILFNASTRFTSDRNKIGGGDYRYQPGYIIERGKNPGLGIKSLHESGITGEGVTIAVIDEALNLDHPEYKGKIIGYKNFGNELSSLQGPAAASLLAGESVGVSPGVKIYYAAVPAYDEEYDAKYYADALDWIVEVNQTLPEGEKIRAACITPNPRNPTPWINVSKYLESFRRASEAGILVLDCTDEHGVIVGACRFNLDDPDDVSLCVPVNAYRIFIAQNHYYGDELREIYNDNDKSVNENMLRVPIGYRTMAQATGSGEFSYQYDGRGVLSWALPYMTGVLAMGWQVRPELTPDEIIEILFDAAYIDDRGNKYIYPANFIESIVNK